MFNPLGQEVMFSVSFNQETLEAKKRVRFNNDLAIFGLSIIVMLFMSLSTINFFSRSIKYIEQEITSRSGEILPILNIEAPTEISSHVEKLNALFSRVNANLRSRDNFFKFILHQSGNTISTILNIASLLRTATDSDEVKRLSLELETQSESLGIFFRQHLKLEQIKNIYPKLEWTNISTLIQKTADTYMLVSEEVNIELKVGLQNHDCYCDPYVLVQAIENIIQNAITHGGKKLRNIKIETLNDADFCKIYIDNDGEMIPANLINRIFTQGQNQLAPENGSGVGLSIVKLVCDLHLGTVSVTSDYGWTCFSIFIPNKRKA